MAMSKEECCFSSLTENNCIKCNFVAGLLFMSGAFAFSHLLMHAALTLIEQVSKEECLSLANIFSLI